MEIAQAQNHTFHQQIINSQCFIFNNSSFS